MEWARPNVVRAQVYRIHLKEGIIVTVGIAQTIPSIVSRNWAFDTGI